MKKQLLFSLIVLVGGCCGSGICPYCNIDLDYDRNMQAGERLCCRECQSNFLVTKGCGTCPIKGELNAERVKIAKQNQQVRLQREIQLFMMNYQYLMPMRTYYRQPGYIPPPIQMNHWPLSDNYWQEEAAFRSLYPNSF